MLERKPGYTLYLVGWTEVMYRKDNYLAMEVLRPHMTSEANLKLLSQIDFAFVFGRLPHSWLFHSDSIKGSMSFPSLRWLNHC